MTPGTLRLIDVALDATAAVTGTVHAAPAGISAASAGHAGGGPDGCQARDFARAAASGAARWTTAWYCQSVGPGTREHGLPSGRPCQ